MSKQSSAGEQITDTQAFSIAMIDDIEPEVEQRGEIGQPEPWTCDVCMTCDPKHCKCGLKPEAQPLPGGTPWDMPTRDRQVYERISSISPENRAAIDGLFKKYADLCFQAIADKDALLERAHKAEAQLSRLSAEGLELRNRIQDAIFSLQQANRMDLNSSHDNPGMFHARHALVILSAPTLSTVQDQEEK